MRIAVDIDSTLHHYWDVLSEAAQRRFGIELPYEEQYSWGITRLKPEQLALCEAETHCDKAILAGRPYAGAVEAINAWSDAGHAVYVTSHRAEACSRATEQWLHDIGLRFEGLRCSGDKRACVAELAIDLLIDDNPTLLAGALEDGVACATVLHPWNEELVEEEGGTIAAAGDWPALAGLLEERFAPLRRRKPARAAAATAAATASAPA